MKRDDIILIKKYVNDLLSEFEKEEDKLRIEHEDMSARIMEINENIHNYHENEDINLQVFSPRKVDNKNEAKLDSLNAEKDVIESDIHSLLKQVKYYTDKTDKLRRILELIDLDTDEEIEDLNYADSDDDSGETVVVKTAQVSSTSFMNGLAEDLEKEEKRELANKEELKDDLLRVAHKIDFCSKIIDNDIFRTKMELKSIKDSVNEIIDNI